MSTSMIDSLLIPTGAFIKTMYAVRDVFAFEPTKEHIATCINYADLQEMRDNFVREMKNMVNGFVYSAAKQKSMIEGFSEGRDLGGASTELHQRACDKFRASCLKGQFSELLLCNLLQHFYRAAPLLRKMPITTNPGLERNGADAIHVGELAGKRILYLGEAKTYHRAQYSFRESMVNVITSVLEHYVKHRAELDLYTYDDFLSPELEALAQQYQQGDAPDLEVHLVCIATYNCNRSLNAKSRTEYLDNIIANIRADADSLKDNAVFTRIPAQLIPRINFILFAVRDLDDLIAAFSRRFGHAN
ncbi:MAG: hypothetical protein JWN70_4551 [Planctomycetaceae bacterium]|nr:hypothetical protein [Planctomycetaceae bacterium]